MSEYTKARKKANQKWDEANKERKLYLSKRSTARAFIRDRIKGEDFEEFKNLIKQKELEIMYLVNVELVKGNEIVEVNFDHQIAKVDTREEAIKAIENDKDSYSLDDADTIIYSIIAVTEEEYETDDYNLDTNDIIEIDLRKADETMKDKMTIDTLTATYYDEANSIYELQFEVDDKVIFLTVDAIDHEEAATDEFYFDDEALIDDLVEDADDEDIEVK